MDPAKFPLSMMRNRTSRLIVSDWLEEQGRLDEADMLRWLWPYLTYAGPAHDVAIVPYFTGLDLQHKGALSAVVCGAYPPQNFKGVLDRGARVAWIHEWREVLAILAGAGAKPQGAPVYYAYLNPDDEPLMGPWCSIKDLAWCITPVFVYTYPAAVKSDGSANE